MSGHDLNESADPANRGRIQAQGGGTEESEKWAQPEPPTMSEMLHKCDLLESKLSRAEKNERQVPLQQLRAFIRRAANYGGIGHTKKSFKKQGSSNIRVDIEVSKGSACVPDPKENSVE